MNKNYQVGFFLFRFKFQYVVQTSFEAENFLKKYKRINGFVNFIESLNEVEK